MTFSKSQLRFEAEPSFRSCPLAVIKKNVDIDRSHGIALQIVISISVSINMPDWTTRSGDCKRTIAA